MLGRSQFLLPDDTHTSLDVVCAKCGDTDFHIDDKSALELSLQLRVRIISWHTLLPFTRFLLKVLHCIHFLFTGYSVWSAIERTWKFPNWFTFQWVCPFASRNTWPIIDQHAARVTGRAVLSIVSSHFHTDNFMCHKCIYVLQTFAQATVIHRGWCTLPLSSMYIYDQRNKHLTKINWQETQFHHLKPFSLARTNDWINWSSVMLNIGHRMYGWGDV